MTQEKLLVILKMFWGKFSMIAKRRSKKDLYKVEFYVTTEVAKELEMEIKQMSLKKPKSKQPSLREMVTSLGTDLNKKLDKVDTRLNNIEKDIKDMKSAPTMSKELKNK